MSITTSTLANGTNEHKQVIWRRTTPEERAELAARYAAGEHVEAIVKSTGHSVALIDRARREAGVPARGGGKRRLADCPSRGAYNRHLRYGEVPCDGCKALNAEESRANRKKQRDKQATADSATGSAVAE